MATATYTVRRLNAKDLFKITSILSVISGEIGEKMKGMDVQSADSQLVGLIYIEAAMKHAEDQLYDLLADLVGMTPDEFAKEPFDAPITILEIVAEQEDLSSFFKKVQALLKKFSGK